MERFLPGRLGISCLLLFGLLQTAAPVHADLSGFRNFAPVNTSGETTAVGYDSGQTILVLSGGGTQQATSAFARTPQRFSAFDASFTYRAEKREKELGDGFAFVLQNDPRATAALGGQGREVGFGGDKRIQPSFVARFGIFGSSSNGFVVNGGEGSFLDTVPVDLRSGHPIRVTLHYDGAVLTETLRDQVTGDTFTEEHAVDLKKVLGKDTALVGFTGASGDATAVQTVRDFAFRVLPPVPVAKRKRIVRPVKVHDTLSSYVDPFIGTANDGNTYPGAVAPFGMVQFSPDTRDASIGYYHGDRTIRGFSMTHMSGVGCNAFGNIFMTATSGPLKTTPADYESLYSHRQESASPGYYRVKLIKPGIDAELTATEHAGLARFTFPAGRAANILIPISHTLTDTPAARIRIVDDRTIEGQVTSQSFCGARQYSTVYFVMRLSEPFKTSGTFAGAIPSEGGREAERKGDKSTEIGAYVCYPAGKQRTITARIGISFVDV